MAASLQFLNFYPEIILTDIAEDLLAPTWHHPAICLCNLEILLMIQLIDQLSQFINYHLNQSYLRRFCLYLRNDSSGNQIYLAPDSDFHVVIHVSPPFDCYLIYYVDIFTEDCFYEEFVGNELFLGDL